MVKSVLGVKHQGLRDWLVQRISALILGIYTVGMFFFLVWHSDLSFAEWHHLFSLPMMKVANILFLFALVFHAWIGMWTIYTDYIKPFSIRIVLYFLTFFILAACLIWGLLVLGSV